MLKSFPLLAEISAPSRLLRFSVIFWFDCCGVLIADGRFKARAPGSPWGHTIIWSLIAETDSDTLCATAVSESAGRKLKLKPHARAQCNWRNRDQLLVCRIRRREAIMLTGIADNICHYTHNFMWAHLHQTQCHISCSTDPFYQARCLLCSFIKWRIVYSVRACYWNERRRILI